MTFDIITRMREEGFVMRRSLFARSRDLGNLLVAAADRMEGLSKELELSRSKLGFYEPTNEPAAIEYYPPLTTECSTIMVHGETPKGNIYEFKRPK